MFLMMMVMMVTIAWIYYESMTVWCVCRDGAAVSALVSHQCGLGSIPSVDAIYGLSLLLVLVPTPGGFL